MTNRFTEKALWIGYTMKRSLVQLHQKSPSSAPFPFIDLEISLLQRMAGKRAAIAASGGWVESPVWAENGLTQSLF